MVKKILLSFCFLGACTLITGCGGAGGPAEYDPSSAEAFTEADAAAEESYEEQLRKEQEELYGK